MAQQYITVISVAYHGSGIEICKNPSLLLRINPGSQSENPWLLYYSQWFDPWLMGNSYDHPMHAASHVKLVEIYENVYRLMPRSQVMVALKKSLGRKFQYSEQYWYNWNLLQACYSFDKVFANRRIFVLRRIVGVSNGDDEIRKLLGDR